MAGHNFTQQQAPPNQTAPWPESMMPIDQTFANQNRYSTHLMQFLLFGAFFYHSSPTVEHDSHELP